MSSSTPCSFAFSSICAPSRPPFRVIDTHAGAGVYDFAGRRGSAQRGMARRHRPARQRANRRAGARAAGALSRLPLRALNSGATLTTYPGSPALVRAVAARAGPADRLRARAAARRPRSRAICARDRRSKAVAIDGWTALNAYVPPKERRGLVLIDPPFEDAGDFSRLAHALAAAHRKWASGIYLLWYPIKERTEPDALARRLRRTGIAKMLRAELSVTVPQHEPAPRRLRPDRGQSAVDARGRTANPAAGARRSPGERGRRRPPPRLARRRKVVSPLFHSPGLAYFYRAGFDVPPPVGAGGVTEAEKAACFPRS